MPNIISDFTVDYLKLVKPYVNVISSGDNKSFDHPDVWDSFTVPWKGRFPDVV